LDFGTDYPTSEKRRFPQLATIGLTGLLVTFSDALNEPANRAALAFRAWLETENWPGVEETTTALTSVYVGFDPRGIDHATLRTRLEDALNQQDWYASPLPRNRRLWHIPTVFGGPSAPQLDQAASLAGLSAAEAIAQLSTQQVRVLTIGYAPGQPYLGILPQQWNIPRQTELTKQVPVGALTIAVRQFVLFTAATPTGWRHIGQTAFRGFQPESKSPFMLRLGDEVVFQQVTAEEMANFQTNDASGAGGTTWREIA
jgi:inhibitor of KinA